MNGATDERAHEQGLDRLGKMKVQVPCGQVMGHGSFCAHGRMCAQCETIKVMSETLEACAQQFAYYAKNHREKAARELGLGSIADANAATLKADVNAQYEAMCRGALT